MLNNSGYTGSPSNLLDLERGGALFVKGTYLFVYKSIFKSNGGLFGGAMYCFSPKLRLFVTNSVFTENYGYIGGAIMIASDSINTIAEIKYNYFAKNSAYRNR